MPGAAPPGAPPMPGDPMAAGMPPPPTGPTAPMTDPMSPPLPANPRPAPAYPKTSNQAMGQASVLSALEASQAAENPLGGGESMGEMGALGMAMGTEDGMKLGSLARFAKRVPKTIL